MKAMGKLLALICAVLLSLPASSYPHGRTPIGRLGGTGGGEGGGQTLVFSYPNFQTTTNLNLASCGDSTFETSSPYALEITGFTGHSTGATWYTTQQNISTGWTTDYTFQLPSNQWGFSFVIQNTNSTTNPVNYGINLCGDANGEGYAVYRNLSQTPASNSVAVGVSNSSQNNNAYLGSAVPNTMGLYMNGGPSMGAGTGYGGYVPSEDLAPNSINFPSGDTMAVHMVYDGSYITYVLKDTVTGAQVRKIWPIALGTVIGSSSAWLGVSGGTDTNPTIQYLLSWDFYEGYNTRLSTPTISPAAGQYTSAQTVTITCPSGATCYYTTNGKLPTTSDTQYTGPFTVSSNEIVSAVATETNFTDSNVAQSNYQIQASGPTINFPSGFTGSSGLIALNGSATLSGSAIQLTDATHTSQSGSAWYAVPVSISGFSTTFTINLNSTNYWGITFVIQNQLPASQDANNVTSGPFAVSGGFNTLGNTDNGMGYAGILESVAVKFDLDGGNNLVGVYQDGAYPGGSNAGDVSAGPITLSSGTPISVTISDTSTTLTVQMTQGSNNFSHTFTVNVPSTVGGSTAYVGFTASTGGPTPTGAQQITNWTGF